ncbi:uncharacterized protein METZ01_LOCUS352415 [marine metagenome]|uniref:Uncharacterized protein n=1 Tax=marine metagenome TaxID=408172 RepID=A0A382RSE3_9ZZZZ
MGLTPLHIKSEIDDLNTFLITKFGYLKFGKCTPSLYVSIDTTNFFFLSKNTSSFNFLELGLFLVSF